MRETTDRVQPSANVRVASTLLLGLLFSLALFYGVIHNSLGEKRRDFLRDSQAATQGYQRAIQTGTQVLTNFELLFGSSTYVDEEEFLHFVRPQLELGDFVGVAFLARLAEGNPYATAQADSQVIEIVTGGETERFAYRYMAHLDQSMEQHGAAMHLMHVLGSSYQQAIPLALSSGDVVLGGLVDLKQKNDTLVIYKPVFRQTASGRELLGLFAALLDPLAALARVQNSHPLNTQLYIDGNFVGERNCCLVQSAIGLPTLQFEEHFAVQQSPFRLVYGRGVDWPSAGIKGAVLAFMLGLLITFFAYRLRIASVARLSLLQERNRVIRRKVDEQTQALRQGTIELQQQKAALDEHAIVSIADTGGSITYINDKFCEISGYTREELIGRNHRIVKSDRHPQSFYDEMWTTISAGKRWHGEICNRSKAGQEYWVRSSIVPFLDERGLPYQYVSIRTDITETKLATQMLQARELELDTILNTVPALIWFKDRDGRILRVNRQAAHLMNHRPEEVEGRFIDEFFPEDAERYRAADRQVMDSGEPLMGQMEEKQLPSGHYHFKLDRVPFCDAQGDIVGVVVMAVDVTRQEEAERALLQNEERLRRSQTFANIGTWDWNVPSGELHWSERIAPLFGHGVGELETTYDNFINAVHPDDRDLVQDAVAACLGGAEYNIEHRVVWPDGQVRWLSETGDVVRDAEGNPLHMLGVVQDIHDRKMAEAALMESEQHLKEAQRMGAIGHWTLDMASGALYWSDEIYRIFGREPGEFEPSYERFFETVHPDDVALVKASEEASKESGSHKVDHRIICADGSVRWVHEEANTILNKAGEVVRMVGTVQDISERNQMQQKLVEAKETAEQASRAKSEFLSSMSHELRTPMNAILGFSQLMEGDENLTAEQRESLGDIGNAGNHLLELINEVLDLAKIESGKLELSIDSVNVGDVMAAAQNLIAPMAEKHEIKLTFADDCSDNCFVSADFTRTKQVLLNLLSNAVKYNCLGGTIQVDCRAVDKGRLRISVSDTGKGIPEVKLKGLFEAFNRLDAEGGNIEGTGIGLVITRQLVELMGGEMGVVTVVGEGSTFWFELPQAQGQATEKKRVAADRDATDTGLGAGRSVLYIEDNPVNLKLVSKLIEKRTAINLLSAEEPIAGIDLALEHQPDLILLDINLPEMSGYEVLRHLRDMEATRDIPVIALSANAMADDLKKGEEAGFDGYLTKPIHVKEFFSVLEKMLG